MSNGRHRGCRYGCLSVHSACPYNQSSVIMRLPHSSRKDVVFRRTRLAIPGCRIQVLMHVTREDMREDTQRDKKLQQRREYPGRPTSSHVCAGHTCWLRGLRAARCDRPCQCDRLPRSSGEGAAQHTTRSLEGQGVAEKPHDFADLERADLSATLLERRESTSDVFVPAYARFHFVQEGASLVTLRSTAQRCGQGYVSGVAGI